MPGPGPHTAYALGAGVGMMRLSRGRFSPQHCLFYAANAFLGPDLGSFAEWFASTLAPPFLGAWPGALASLAMEFVHHPFYYPLLLGFPLSAFYAWLSAALLRRGLLDTASGVPLSRRQCFLLVSAGSLTHFFLDHLFEENGHSRTYSWILSTGWWNGRAPINFDATIVVGLLCISLIGGFIYINRVKSAKSITTKATQSAGLIVFIMSLYCLWCSSQIYWLNPPQPAVGEEADLGVIVFLAVYFFLPHSMCILSMNSKEYLDSSGQLPL
uniref:Polyprotein n=1 Tax=Anthurium amnicola TaxID=1678845 RepID=A0A1D1YXS3_9ARAE